MWLTMNYSHPYAQIDVIANDILSKFQKNEIYPKMKITRIRSPIHEMKFLSQYETFNDIYGKSSTNNEIGFGFHATSMTNINSIINNGLFAPYETNYVKKCGNKYGKGVYISETYDFARNYYRGCMLVVAILYGEKKIMNSAQASTYSNQEIDTDTFVVSPEIVLRGSSQALPLFIIDPCNDSINNVLLLDDIPQYNTFDANFLSMAKEIHDQYPSVLLCTIMHLLTMSINDNIPDKSWVVTMLEEYNYEI